VVLTPLLLRFQIFWDTVQCWSVRNCHYIAGNSCSQPDGIQRSDIYSWYYSWTTPNMEEGRSHKNSYLCTHIHSITSQETVLFRLTAVTIKYIHSSNTSTTFYKVSTGNMFWPPWAIIRPDIWTGSFDFSAFWDPKLLQRCY